MAAFLEQRTNCRALFAADQASRLT